MSTNYMIETRIWKKISWVQKIVIYYIVKQFEEKYQVEKIVIYSNIDFI